MSRVYEGFREEDRTVLVVVNGKPLNPRNDLMNHSPDGFEYGYGGSGPAQLALAILADHFKHHPEDMAFAKNLQERKGGAFPPRQELEVGEDPFKPSKRKEADHLAVRCHQHFKGAFVAGLPRDSSWRLDSEGVTEILKRMANHGIPDRFHREEPV